MLFAERWMVGADRGISDQRATREAAAEYEKWRQRGVGRRCFRRLGGKGVWLATPSGTCEGRPTRDRWVPGTLRAIAITDINGSVMRNREYDAEFYPVVDSVRERWIAVMAQLLQGRELPAVRVIRIENGLYVNGGFEAISVARMLGQTEVDAMIVDESGVDGYVERTEPVTVR